MNFWQAADDGPVFSPVEKLKMKDFSVSQISNINVVKNLKSFTPMNCDHLESQPPSFSSFEKMAKDSRTTSDLNVDL